MVIYAPLGETPVAPDAVLIAGKPSRVMLLAEAAGRAGVMSNLPLLGRPACMAIPAALANGTVTSSGCIGNRVYTGIGDDEMYIVLRGADLERVAAEIDAILSANQTLREHHQERRRTLRPPAKGFAPEIPAGHGSRKPRAGMRLRRRQFAAPVLAPRYLAFGVNDSPRLMVW